MRKARAVWAAAKGMDPGIRDEIEKIRLVDGHEHLDEEAVRLSQPNDLVRFFMYYTFDDVTTTGKTGPGAGAFFKAGTTVEEQWRAIRDAWPLARNTGYARAVQLSIQELYGIDDLRDDTVKPLLAAIAKRNRPGVLDWLLRDKAGIEVALVNAEDPGDLARRTASPGLFLFDIAVSPFLQGKPDLAPYEKASGKAVESLRDWHRMIDWYFDRWGRQAVAIKNVSAYWRVLKYDEVSESDAAPLFEKWLVRKEEVNPAERKAVQDHLFDVCVRKATELDLAIKIHTGYHAGTGYTDLDVPRARDLASLFRRHPKARFDLFHISYPEWPDVIALAKHYPNVVADMCWAWGIDPEGARQFARQALHALPVNKVHGFGGDVGYADMVYGYARIARDSIAAVLTEAVREGRLTRPDAKAVARRWLRDNAMEFYRIDKRRAAQAAGQPAPLAG